MLDEEVDVELVDPLLDVEVEPDEDEPPEELVDEDDEVSSLLHAASRTKANRSGVDRRIMPAL